MIRPEKIRIGNWIQILDDGPWVPMRVTGVTKTSITCGAITIYKDGEKGFRHGARGIPMPNVLDNCGFKSDSHMMYTKCIGNDYEYFMYSPTTDRVSYLHERSGSFLLPITQYLHEFQNLFHAIMGEELKMKNP